MLESTLLTWESGKKVTRASLRCALFTALLMGCPGVEPMQTGGFGGSGASASSVGGGGSSSSAGAGGQGGEDPCEGIALDTVDNCGECGTVCEKPPEAMPVCEAGKCKFLCKPGRRDLNGEAEDGCEVRTLRVFLTSMPVGAHLLGADGAHTKCQEFAQTAMLEGDWKAWISDSEESPGDWLDNVADVAYVTFLDDIVVHPAISLLAPAGQPVGLMNPINVTEGSLIMNSTVVPVWTGTSPVGVSTDQNCGNWNPGKDPQVTGTVGNASATGPAWTAVDPKNAVPCTGQARLYCFEQ